MKVDKSIRIAFTVDWSEVIFGALVIVLCGGVVAAVCVPLGVSKPDAMTLLTVVSGMMIQRIWDRGVRIGGKAL